jgi:hypothetical protein
MEKFAIELETNIGWVTYHTILRPGEERARMVLQELVKKYPQAKFRIIQWVGTPLT